MIIKYSNFRYFFLLESLLKVDPDFLNLLKDTSSKDPIAKMLLGLINQDITTNVNYLKPSDKNDDIKFVNDTQVKRFLDSGLNPFDRATNSAKIGRTVRQILSANKISFTDQQIEKFVNTYKNSWDKIYKKNKQGFHLVSGEEIREWYLESTYVPGGGTLNSSCMRYESTQNLLDIYTENKEVCQLLILVDDRNRLLGRALLWKLKSGSGLKDYFLDRIYTRFDNDMEKFVEWFRDFMNESSDNFNAHFLGNLKGLRVQLKKWKFEKYPYMDSLPILDYESGVLMAYDGVDFSRLQYHIQNTNGDPNVPNHNFSNAYGIWLHDSECVWINYKDDYYPKDECVLDYKNNWILKDDSVYSDFYKSYIEKSNSEVVPEFGLVDKNDLITVYDDVVDGELKKERRLLFSKLDKASYKKVEFGFSYVWINSDVCFYDAENHDYVVQTEDFDDYYIKLVCIDASEIDKLKEHLDIKQLDSDDWGIEDSDIDSEAPLVFELYNDFTGNSGLFATKEFVNTFSLKINDTENKVVIKKRHFYRKYMKMCYERTLEIINQVKDFDIKPILGKLEEINKWCSENFSRYRENNSSYQMIKKYGSYTNYLNTEIAKEFKKYKLIELIEKKDKDIIDSLEKYIKDNERSFELDFGGTDFTIKNDENLRESIILFLENFKDAILFYTYFLILFNDRDYADFRLDTYLRVNKMYDSRLIGLLCRYSEFSGKYASNIDSIRTKISEVFNYRKLMDEQDTTGYDSNYERNQNIYKLFLGILNKD